MLSKKCGKKTPKTKAVTVYKCTQGENGKVAAVCSPCDEDIKNALYWKIKQ